MLGDVDEIFGRDFRYSRGRRRPDLSPSRERDRAERRRDGKAVRALLAAHRAPQSRRRNDVQVKGKLLPLSQPPSQGQFAAGPPLLLVDCPVPQTPYLTFSRFARAGKTRQGFARLQAAVK